uniref:Uncharacterized protein n=1 Tax=viral metagenome TaxID=1070528 RepID=A0A6C0LUG5_9ZZZZ
MIIESDFQRKSVEDGAVGAKVSLPLDRSKGRQKGGEEASLGWSCGEWIGSWGRVSAKQGYSRPEKSGYQFI